MDEVGTNKSERERIFNNNYNGQILCKVINNSVFWILWLLLAALMPAWVNIVVVIFNR